MPQLPFDYLDKACLAATNGPSGCSNAPTWTLWLDGQPGAEELRQTLRWLTTAYPTCAARVVALGADPQTAKNFAWEWDSPVAEATLASMVEFHDLREDDGPALDRLRDEVHDRFLDLHTTPPLLLVLAWLAEGKSALFLKQHHGLADGRGIVEMLPDLGRFLNHARAGTTPEPAELAEVPRRSELEAIAATPWRRRWLACLGVLEYTRSAFRTLRHPLTPLRQNLSLVYTGGNRTLHKQVTPDELSAWREAAKRAGVNLNAALIGAWMVANRRWNEAHGVHVARMNATTAIDLRPRGVPFRSFANHLGFHIPDLLAPELASVTAALPSIHAQVHAQNARQAHLRRYFFERWFASLLSLGAFRQLLFSAPKTVVNLNFSNVLALPIARLEGPGWRVTDVHVSTPLIPRTAVVLTVTSYDGAATLNFNWKDSVVPRAEVEELADIFRATIADWAQHD